MINVCVTCGEDGAVCAILIQNHGDPIVCSAVSALAINTVNSIEQFTDEVFLCDYDEQGGMLELTFQNAPESGVSGDAGLLLRSLMLGLESVAQEHTGQVKITYSNNKAKKQ